MFSFCPIDLIDVILIKHIKNEKKKKCCVSSNSRIIWKHKFLTYSMNRIHPNHYLILILCVVYDKSSISDTKCTTQAQ